MKCAESPLQEAPFRLLLGAEDALEQATRAWCVCQSAAGCYSTDSGGVLQGGPLGLCFSESVWITIRAELLPTLPSDGVLLR